VNLEFRSLILYPSSFILCPAFPQSFSDGFRVEAALGRFTQASREALM